MNIEYEHDEIFETAKDDFQSYHSIYVQQRFVWIYSVPATIQSSLVSGKFHSLHPNYSNHVKHVTLKFFFYFFRLQRKLRTSIRFGYLVWRQDFYQTAFWNLGWIDFWERMVSAFYFDILNFSVSELVSTSLVGIWTDLWSFIHVFTHLWRLLKS